MRIDKNNYEAFLLDYIEGNLSAEMTAELMLFLQQHPEIETGMEDFKIISLKKENTSFDSKNDLKRKEFVVNDDLIEGLIISFVNGDLSKEESKKLLEIVNGNSEYELLLAQYQSTRIISGNEKITDKVLLKGHLPVSAENAEYFIIAETEGVITVDEKKSLDDYRSAFPGIKELSVAYAGTKLNRNEKFVFENKSSLKKKEAVVISMWLRYASVAAAAFLILYFGFFTSNDTVNTVSYAQKVIDNTNQTPTNNLIANDNNPNEEIKEESIPEVNDKFVPNHGNNSNNQIAREEKKNDSPIFKEPIIDGGLADDGIHEEKNNNDAPVLYAREELKVITNDDQYALANANTNVSSLNEDDFITPGQYVRNWAKKTFFTEVAQADHNNADQNTEMADNSVLKLKGTDNTTISNSKGKDYKQYGFSIGKFSFQRKVKK